MTSLLPKLDLGSFPFYWRIKYNTSNHEIIPEEIPYSLTIDPSLNLLIEERTTSLLQTLNLMYKQDSNIGFLQDGHTLAQSYGDDFYRVIEDMISRYSISTALEVGCGGCYLLSKVSALGVPVVGIDPSPIANKKSIEKNLKVINSFYPSEELNDSYDLIYHVDVFEHVSDPTSFLSHHMDNLSPNGIVIVNVPDNTRSIELGDISLATHQHLNSFDELSLFQTFQQAGFTTIDILKSKFGGSLYGIATPKSSCLQSNYVPTFPESMVTNFFKKAAYNIDKFSSFANNLVDSGQELGFYMPLRSFPYLSVSGLSNKVRLFDDISHWHHSHIGSSQKSIENFEDLARSPVDHLFIMSHSFGHGLKKKVIDRIPGQQVTLLSEILSNP